MSEDYLGIDHIGVAVNDLDAAVHTYRDVLGFEVAGGELLDERGLKVAFVETGGGERIELIAPTRLDSEVSPFLQKRGGGVHHICLRVANIERTVAALQKRGAQLVAGGIRPGAHDTRVAFIHPKACHGVLLELVEHPAAQKEPT